jgi:CDP-glucose 4,6-dehydratase
VITTDKVYRNTGQVQGYREDDALGAADPYSTSKAMADLLAQSFVASVRSPPTAIARGGNVIGGGDISAERLMPDLVKSFLAGEPASIRNPLAVRPWQHVLDCLDGYLAIVGNIHKGRGLGAWNIGPGRESFVSVGEVATEASALWGHGASWVPEPDGALHEAHLLSLDPRRAELELNWRSVLPYPTSLEWVVEWHQKMDNGADARSVTLEQIERFAFLKGEPG